MKIFRNISAVVFLALAACPGLAEAACYGPDKQVPAQTMSDFLSNPSSLLGQSGNANGGAGMTSQVRDLVASDPAALPALMGLLSSANDGQMQAIGSGLGQAALLCLRPDPTFAAQIQAIIADPKYAAFGPFRTAYSAATGNQPIGSVAAGGAGGGVSGGGVGGQTSPFNSVSGSSGVQSFTNSSFTNPSTNYFSSSLSSASSGTQTTTTSATSVSP